jgi:uncharacterized Tic20 family protein
MNDQIKVESPAELEQNKDARTWGMFCHLTALAGFIIPFGNIIGPLVIWLIKKNDHPFVDDQGKESLNFQVTVTIAALIAGALICVFVGIILLPLVGILAVVFAIIAALKANEGKRYRYPFALRLIK